MALLSCIVQKWVQKQVGVTFHLLCNRKTVLLMTVGLIYLGKVWHCFSRPYIGKYGIIGIKLLYVGIV